MPTRELIERLKGLSESEWYLGNDQRLLLIRPDDRDAIISALERLEKLESQTVGIPLYDLGKGDKLP